MFPVSDADRSMALSRLALADGGGYKGSLGREGMLAGDAGKAGALLDVNGSPPKGLLTY